MITFNKLILIAFLILPLAITAQVSALIAELEKKYPNEGIVTLIESKTYRIEMKDNRPKVFLDIYSEKIILNDLFVSASEGEVHFSMLKKLKSLEAWTMTPVKDDYKKSKVEKYAEKKEFGSQIFHDDIATKVFQFPDLKKGAKRCQKESYEFELAEIFDYVYLMTGSPTVKYTVDVAVDNRIHFDFIEYNLSNVSFKFDKKVEKSETLYSWIFENLSKHKDESGATDYLYYAPHIRFFIRDYIAKSGDTIPVLKDTKALYKFNYKFIANLKTCSDVRLKASIDSLVKGESNELLKAKMIYYWVKKNIKYIAFEDGFQGYIPREADDIYDKKYGDCKDMANILHKSFHYAGLDSIYLTWIGTTEIPYKIREFNHPGLFNHMVAVWKHHGRNYLLDATNTYTTWGLPSSFVQGKEAFISIDSQNYEIWHIEPVDYSINRRTKNIELTLENETLKGKGECIISGYQRDRYLARTDGLQGNERFQYIKNYLELGNNKFQLDKFKELNLENLDSVVRIQFEFTLPNYNSVLKDEIFINLFLEKYGVISDLNEKRIAGFKGDFHSLDDINIELQIPEGYDVKYTPKDENIEFSEFYFNSMFRRDGNKLSLRYEFANEFLILPKEKYKDLKVFQNKILEALSETISLKKSL